MAMFYRITVFILVAIINLLAIKNISAQSMNWCDVGLKKIPDNSNGIGRIDYIAFDPAPDRANRMFACSPWGGLFISEDYGANWVNIDYALKVDQPASSCIYIDPEDNTGNTWYVASGNADGPHNAGFGRESKGLYRTTDNGVSWESIGPVPGEDFEVCTVNFDYNGKTINVGFIINDIIQGPDSREHIIVSTSCGMMETYNSLDEDPTWEIFMEGCFFSVRAKPDEPHRIFCSEQYKLNAKVWEYNYLTQDTTEIETGYSNTYKGSRIVLRFSKDDPDHLFIFFYYLPGVAITGTMTKVMRYDFINGLTVPKGEIRLGNPDRADGVHVSNGSANVLFVANGINTPRKSENGLDYNDLTTVNISNTTIHVDQHFITQSPHNNALWVANDGGVWVLESGSFVEKSDGLAVSTIDDFDVAQLEDEIRYVAGYQDVGNIITDYDWSIGMDDSKAFIDWCDGRQNNFDPNDYNYFTGGCPKGEASLYWQDPLNKIVTSKGKTRFKGKIHFDKSSPSVAYDIIDGELFKSLDRGLLKEPVEKWCPYDNLRAFEISPTNSDVMYCFSDSIIGGQAVLYKSVVGGGNSTSKWEIIKYADSNFDVLKPLVDYDNPHHLWICEDNSNTLYSFNTKTMEMESLFEKDNSPHSWSAPIIASIEQEYNSNQGIYIVVNSYKEKSDVFTKYVLYTDLTLDHWISVKEGLPNIKITGVKINNKDQEIYAATYGRGMWKSDLYCSAVPGDFNLPGYYIDSSKHVQGTITGSGTVSGLVTLRAGEEIVLNPGFETASGADFMAIARPCGSNGGALLKSTQEKEREYIQIDDSQIEDQVIDELYTVYPNPSNGLIHIKSSDNTSFSYKVYNSVGTLILEKSNVFDDEFDLSRQPSGLYFIQVSGDNNMEIKKIIIN